MFTEQDFKNRVETVRAKMAEANLNALVILDDDRWIDGGNVRYLTNYYHLFDTMPMAVIITPKDVSICVIPGLGAASFAVAKQQCPWVNAIGTRFGLWGSNLGKDIKSALDKAGITGGKVGVDGFGIMQEPLCKGVREALKGFEIVEETKIVEKLRMTKSAKEIDAIREAVRLTDMGLKACYEAIKPGDPQYIAMSKSDTTARVAGAEEVLVFMGVGLPWIWGQYPSRRKFQDGDMVAFEYNARYEGYYGQVNRTYIVGKPNDKQLDVYKATYDSYKAIEAKVKPGVTASELYKAGADVIVKAGFEKPPRLGHGMGLTIAECCEIDEHDYTEMKPGYYLMVHTLVAVLDKGHAATVGNPLVITDKGYENMSKADYPIKR